MQNPPNISVIDNSPSLIDDGKDVSKEEDVASYKELIEKLGRENSNLKKLVEELGSENFNFDEELKREELYNLELYRKLREKYAKYVFRFLVFYCIIVFALIILHGFSICNFKLHSSVLVTIAGSTAVSAIGLVGIVITGLFDKK